MGHPALLLLAVMLLLVGPFVIAVVCVLIGALILALPAVEETKMVSFCAFVEFFDFTNSRQSFNGK